MDSISPGGTGGVKPSTAKTNPTAEASGVRSFSPEAGQLKIRDLQPSEVVQTYLHDRAATTLPVHDLKQRWKAVADAIDEYDEFYSGAEDIDEIRTDLNQLVIEMTRRAKTMHQTDLTGFDELIHTMKRALSGSGIKKVFNSDDDVAFCSAIRNNLTKAHMIGNISSDYDSLSKALSDDSIAGEKFDKARQTIDGNISYLLTSNYQDEPLLEGLLASYKHLEALASHRHNMSPAPLQVATPQSAQIGGYQIKPVTREMVEAFKADLSGCFTQGAKANLMQYMTATSRLMIAASSEEEAMPIQHSIRQRMTESFLLQKSLIHPSDDLYGEPEDDEQGSYEYQTSEPAPYALNIDRSTEIEPHDFTGCPLAHSRVQVTMPGGKPMNLCANHMHIAGKDMGIAMQAPRDAELDYVLQALMENQIETQIDLVSDHDRKNFETLYQPGRPEKWPMNWKNVAQGKVRSKQFELVQNPEEPITLKHENRTFDLVKRHFTITDNKNPQIRHEFDQYSLKNWPDGDSLPVPVLKDLVKLIEGKKTMINCVAGVGRTNTLFVGRHIHETVMATGGKGQGGRLAMEGLVHARFSRSGMAVQTPPQARSLIQLEDSYD